MSTSRISSPGITASPSQLLPDNVKRSDSSLAGPDESRSGRRLGLSSRREPAPDEASASRRFADAPLSTASRSVTTLAALLGMSRRREAAAARDIEAGTLGSARLPTEGTMQAEAAVDVARPAAAVMKRLEEAIHQAVNREVDAAKAADLANTMRRVGRGPRGAARAATNDDLMKDVTDDKVKEWYAAQGLTDGDVKALRDAAFQSGLPNPTGSFLNNAVQYIASPWTNFALSDKTKWGGAAVGFFAAGVGAPMNALQQSAVVTLCESIREHGGPVIVPDKKNINDKHYLPDLAKTFENRVNEFGAAHDQLHKTMGELELDAMAHADAHGLAEGLKSLRGEEVQKLREHVAELLEAEMKLFDTQRDFMMTQGAHARQWKGNTWQAIPRTLRAPVAGYTGLLSKLKVPKFASPTAQTVASVVLTATQHLAAGLDERNKQEYNNKLNLLYGDFFSDRGNEKLKSGQPIEASDIDPKKLRNFVNMPEQSLVKHVAAELKRLISGLKGLDGSATDATALAALEHDERALKAGKLTELRPGGLAESLLVASDSSVISPQLWADVKAKYTTREFSAQTAQRLGQMFHLVAFGSAASSVVGKVTSAASGGARLAPTAQTIGVSTLSGAMAGFGALNQHTAISVKNNRREAGEDPGLGRQLLRGGLGGAAEFMSQRRGTRASREMNKLLGEEAIGHRIQFARNVEAALGPLQTRVEVPLAQAPRPGEASTSGVKEIAINVAELPSTSAAGDAGIV